MPCPPGPACGHVPDCRDMNCPGHPFAPPARGFGADTARSTSTLQRGFDTRRVRDGQPPAAHQPTPASGGTVEWLHIRPGGHRVDGPAGTTHRLSTDPAQSPSDTEVFWIPHAPTEPLYNALDAAIDRLLFASPFVWLVVAVLSIASAICLGLLAGHVSELGSDRVWALLGGAK